MGTKKFLGFLTMAMVFSLTVAACTVGGAPAGDGPTGGVSAGGTARPTATRRTPSTAVPPGIMPTIVAGATPTGGTPVPVGTLETRAVKKLSSGLEKLKSYRTRLTLGFEGNDKNGNPQKGTLDYLQETYNDSKDQHIRVAGTGDLASAFGSAAGAGASAGTAFETYRVSDNTFLIQNGKCQFVGSGSSASGGSAIFSPDEFIGSLDRAVLVARGETVNGVSADHYQFNDLVLTTGSMAGMKVTKGDLWLTADGYVVKANGNATGKTRQGSDGAVTLNYDIDTINQLGALKAPPDCILPSLANDVPLPTNAIDKKVVNNSGTTLTTFKSPDSVSTVADFFRANLPPQGWKLESDRSPNPAALTLSFTKDGGKRTLNINVLIQSGSTSVIMTDKAASQ